MAVTVKYFGAIEEITGIAEESIGLAEVSGSLEQLKELCLSKYQGINDLSFQLAVNQALMDTATLRDGDEVAFLPPFAGG